MADTKVTDERIMRCEVSGGFVEVRYRHDMSAEDVGDLIAYLDVLRKHLSKRIDRSTSSEAAPPTPASGEKETKS